MSEVLASLLKSGVSGSPTMELLNTPVTVTTSNQTINLSHPLSDYDYLVFAIGSTSSIVFDGHVPTTLLHPLMDFVTPSYFQASGSCLGYGVRGSEGSFNTLTYTMTYVDDVSLNVKYDTSVGTPRYFYIYGIKYKQYGNGWNETILWVNPAPTSNLAETTITLSDSLDNYDYIKVKYAYNVSYQTSEYTSEMYMSVDDLKKSSYSSTGRRTCPAFNGRNNANNFFRLAMYVSDTQIRFSGGIRGSDGATVNDMCMPLQIVGVKR